MKEVLDLQDYYTTRVNEALVGSDEEILVEGYSKKQKVVDLHGGRHDFQWTGRTSTNKIVNFVQNDNGIHGDEIRAGKLVSIRIMKAFPHSLWGEPVKAANVPLGFRGEKAHVA